MRLHFKKISGKNLLKLQAFVCFALIAVMLLLSFGTLYSIRIEVPQSMQDGIELIEEVLNDPLVSSGEEIAIDFPEELDINMLLFIRAAAKIDDIVDLYKGMLSLADVADAKTSNEYHQAYSELRALASQAKEIIEDRDFINFIALAATLVSGFSQSTLNGVVMIIMILMTIILPVALLSALIIAIFAWFYNLKDHERLYLSLVKAFRRAARAYLLVIAVRLFDPNISLALGLELGLIVCVGGFAFAAIMSRSKLYTSEGKRYMNIVQITSASELAGFIIFYFGLAKSGAVGQYFAIVAKDALGFILSKEYGESFLSQFMFMVSAVAAIVALVCTLAVLTGTLARLGSMMPRNRESGIVLACLSLVFIIIPLVTTANDARFVLEKGQTLALSFAFVGASVMIFSEVAIIVLRKMFCADLKESEKYAVLRGLDVVETEWYDDED